MKEEETHDLYLMLVDKGFNKHRGFFCLNRIRGDYKRYFAENEIADATEYGLNAEFSGIVQRAYDDFKFENKDKSDEEIKALGLMQGAVTENLQMLLERDYRVSQIVIQNQSDFRDSTQMELNYSLMEDLKEDVRH